MTTEVTNTATAKGVNVMKNLLGVAIILAQLALIILVLEKVDMLTASFRRAIYLTLPGFLIHHLLPVRFRLKFFILISIFALLVALGFPAGINLLWSSLTVLRILAVLGVGGLLIGICHLPIGYWKRVALLVGSAVCIAGLRLGIPPTGNFAVIWIILPAILIFRIVTYLYDVSVAHTRPSVEHTVAYFTLLPNAIFNGTIPVIDFKAFCGSSYNQPPFTIYQRGIQWMGRGIIHLLIYRYSNHLLSIWHSDVHDGISLLRLLVSLILSYLNVSGRMHFIIGILLLFGFNLPAPHHRYFLASGFTDVWNRTNIYWRDFMMKVFYYPLYFKFKHLGSAKAVIAATFWVFTVSCFFHIYEGFWSTGRVWITLPNTLYWWIFGALILSSSLKELKRSRKHSSQPAIFSWKEACYLGAKTAGTFAVVWLALWSFYLSPDIATWFHIWRFADRHTALGIIGILLIVMIAKIVTEVIPTRRKKKPVAQTSAAAFPISWGWTIGQTALPLLSIYFCAAAVSRAHLPELSLLSRRVSLQRYGDILLSGDTTLSYEMAVKMNPYRSDSGQYEPDRQLQEILFCQPVPISPRENPVLQVVTDDFRFTELKPNFEGESFEIHDFKTNRWGMRDKEFPQTKTAHTLRIALLGSADVMGYGIGFDDAFGTVVEKLLNGDSLRQPSDFKYEILNFAVPGYSLLSQVDVLRLRAGAFQPDVVIVTADLADFKTTARHLQFGIHEGIPPPSGEPQRIMQIAPVSKYTRFGLGIKRLAPHELELVGWILERLANECRNLNATPVFVLLPEYASQTSVAYTSQASSEQLRVTAKDAGFSVIDLSHSFDHETPTELTTGIVPHFSTQAHRIIADALFQKIRTQLQVEVSRRHLASSAEILSTQIVPPADLQDQSKQITLDPEVR